MKAMVAPCSGTDAGLELNACTISKLATEKRSGGWYYCEHKEGDFMHHFHLQQQHHAGVCLTGVRILSKASGHAH